MVLPAHGHINPITGLAKELVAKKSFDVIFYGNIEHKDLIERTGATFRQYSHILSTNFKHKPLNEDKHDALEDLFTKMINISYEAVPVLLQQVENDKPDLIIYDHFSFPARYMLKVMESRFAKGLSQQPTPPAVNFYTCFASKDGLYPSNEQLQEIVGGGFRLMATMARLIMRQSLFSWKFGINIYNPVNFIYNESEKLNLVSVFPELHPHSDKFDSSYKFVGCCLSENIRKLKTSDSKLTEIIEFFQPLNPNFSLKNFDQNGNENRFKLVYASLGTVFNNNIFIFDMIIESIKIYNELYNDPDSPKLKVIVALGQENYNIYQERIKNESYEVPENVLLVITAPQIDILERASLFITHCGMNSASEAIQYGVPVICLPIKGDQLLVAERLADDLNLGIKFDPLKMTSLDLKSAIEKILKDDFYLKNMLNFTKISRNYNGSVTSANLVENYLNDFYKVQFNQ
ncbi:unnamed protein product [Brachionus calyciflorus]|uniref:Glucuronosyltransferase n=1 Tax=Brachionus calyciflorus TaxID=104777 RepID=A0A813S352_9BILA|nr:unnamed protein product [Brachionus calyciflorus]